MEPISFENLFKILPKIKIKTNRKNNLEPLQTAEGKLPDGLVLKKYIEARVMPSNMALCRRNEILIHIVTNVMDRINVTTIIPKVIIAKI